MPLIVEDGTLPENANSYVALTQADAYLVPRSLWPATTIEESSPEEPQEPELPDDGNENEEAEKEAETETETKETQESGQPLLLNTGDDDEETDPEESETPDPELPEDADSEPLPDTGKPDDNPDIAKKEAALMRAFDYLNGPLVWKGNKVDWQRMVAWPRENVPIPGCNPKKPEYIPNDAIPTAVCRAQMELAAYIYNGHDMFAPLERGGKYTSKSDSESVDVLSESHSIAYAENAPVEDWLPSVYSLLKPYLDEVPGEVKSAFSVYDVLRG